MSSSPQFSISAGVWREVLPLPPATKKPEVRLHALDAFFEGAAEGGGDAAGMPVEAQHAAEGLEPVGVGEAAQHLLGAVLGDDGDGDLTGELDHALEEPARGFAVVQGQVGDAGSLRLISHGLIIHHLYLTTPTFNLSS